MHHWCSQSQLMQDPVFVFVAFECTIILLTYDECQTSQQTQLPNRLNLSIAPFVSSHLWHDTCQNCKSVGPRV